MAKKFIAILPLALFLAIGCSKEGGHSGKIGVSAGTEQSSNTEQSSILGRVKSLAVGKTAKSTIHVPAITLISKALLDDGVTRNPSKNIPILCIAGSSDQLLNFLNMTEKEEAGPSAMRPRGGYHQLFSLAMQPSPLWHFRGNKDCATEARIRATSIYFSSALFQRLANILSVRSYPDEAAAVAAIRDAYLKLPETDFCADYERAWDKAHSGKVILDWTTAEMVSFQLSGDSFSFARNGNSVAGTIGKLWSNDGWINGQQLSFNVEKSSSETMSRESRDSEKGAISTTGKTSTNVGVQ